VRPPHREKAKAELLGRQKSDTMAQYDVYFVDQASNVYDAVRLEQDTDDAAIVAAHRLNVASIGNGFDVWRERRLVHRHRRS
jgi:hypothetical protein